MPATAAIQRALKDQGFDPGPLDGAMGPHTRAAIARFEASRGLRAGGAPDAAFLGALLGDSGESWLPWFEEAKRRQGLHETRDEIELAGFLRSDGSSVGDPTKLPWCGDFVETCMAVGLPGEPLPENPYLARNWLKFGIACDPAEGAVLVFWRGSKSGTSGHVGFYAGEDGSDPKGAFHVLGGNQSNAVTTARIAKSRLLGARWPKIAPPPTGGRIERRAAGALSNNEA